MHFKIVAVRVKWIGVWLSLVSADIYDLSKALVLSQVQFFLVNLWVILNEKLPKWKQFSIKKKTGENNVSLNVVFDY